jgi:hypothetical protein
MAGTSPDLEINSAVRRVLVRHWIDLGRISIRAQKGRVTLRGILDKLPESDQTLTGAVLESMFGDIRRLHGVQRVNTELENWEQTSFGWRAREGEVTASDGSISGHSSGGQSKINIDEWLRKTREELKAKEEDPTP